MACCRAGQLGTPMSEHPFDEMLDKLWSDQDATGPSHAIMSPKHCQAATHQPAFADQPQEQHFYAVPYTIAPINASVSVTNYASQQTMFTPFAFAFNHPTELTGKEEHHSSPSSADRAASMRSAETLALPLAFNMIKRF